MRYLFMSDVTNPRARGWGNLAPLKIYCRAVRSHSGTLPWYDISMFICATELNVDFGTFIEVAVSVSLENYQLSKDSNEYFRGSVTPQQKLMQMHMSKET